MFCPHCGATDQNPKAYCRKCGEWLFDPKSQRSSKAKTPADSVKTMLVFSATSSIFGLFSAIALYATYLGKPEVKWSIYVAAAFCMVIAAHQSANFIIGLQLRKTFKRGRQSETDRANANTRGELDAAASITDPRAFLNQAEPSVTESTTELLDQEPDTRERPRSEMAR